MGAGVGTWEEMDEFVRAFEGFAVADVSLLSLSTSPSCLPSPRLHADTIGTKQSSSIRANGTPNASNGITAASPST